MSRQLYKAFPELKTFSTLEKSFAKALFRKRSWWLLHFGVGSYDFVTEDGHRYKGGPYFEVCLPSPIQPPERDLYFNFDGRVTVVPQKNMDCHGHLYLNPENDIDLLIDQTLAYIDPVLEEEVVIVEWEKIKSDGTSYIATTTCWRNQLEGLGQIHSIRSWKGTYDAAGNPF